MTNPYSKKIELLEIGLFALIQALIRKNVLQSDDYLQSIATASVAAQKSGDTERVELLLEHIVKMKMIFESGKGYK